MPGFVIYLLAFALVALGFAAISVQARRRTYTTAASTNRLLFAIVILLFAIVVKFVTSGMDILVLAIALVGLGVGCYGIRAQPAD